MMFRLRREKEGKKGAPSFFVVVVTKNKERMLSFSPSIFSPPIPLHL